MKPSILPLILLFVICVLLPTIFKCLEGMNTWKDSEGNIHYDYTTDLDSLSKSTKMDPTEDIATPDSNLASNFFDSVHTGPYYADDGENESKYISHSKLFKGYKDVSGNLVSENSSNVLPGSTERSVDHPYANSSVSDALDPSTKERIKYDLGIITYFRNLFKRNTETFATRHVNDISDNKMYDISANYELYNEDGTLKMGIHDPTDYGTLLEILEKEYTDLENKYKTKTKPDPIKCIADFATDIGEELCCGQTGVLQNTKYVCPSNVPTCSNFKCGSKFGTCS